MDPGCWKGGAGGVSVFHCKASAGMAAWARAVDLVLGHRQELVPARRAYRALCASGPRGVRHQLGVLSCDQQALDASACALGVLCVPEGLCILALDARPRGHALAYVRPAREGLHVVCLGMVFLMRLRSGRVRVGTLRMMARCTRSDSQRWQRHMTKDISPAALMSLGCASMHVSAAMVFPQ